MSQIIERMEVSHLLDYGCGSLCNLAKHLKLKRKLKYQAYDPGVPRFAHAPVPAELVCAIDVLEHIEPAFLDAVLNDLCRLSEAVVFLSIDTGPAVKTLADGRNAHLIQQPLEWWLPKLSERWDLQTVQVMSEHGFYFIGFAKARIEGFDGQPIL